MNNQKIRTHAKEKGICLWQIAEKMNINDSSLSRKLRHELSETERETVIEIIDNLALENMKGVRANERQQSIKRAGNTVSKR